jgi:hypothetical protein
MNPPDTACRRRDRSDSLVDLGVAELGNVSISKWRNALRVAGTMNA